MTKTFLSFLSRIQSSRLGRTVRGAHMTYLPKGVRESISGGSRAAAKDLFIAKAHVMLRMEKLYGPLRLLPCFRGFQARRQRQRPVANSSAGSCAGPRGSSTSFRDSSRVHAGPRRGRWTPGKPPGSIGFQHHASPVLHGLLRCGFESYPAELQNRQQQGQWWEEDQRLK